MPVSSYDIVELVGTSEKSWEDALRTIVTQASKTIRNLRIAEVVTLDAKIENQKIVLYRARIKLSFKLEETKPEEPKPKEKKDVISQKRK